MQVMNKCHVGQEGCVIQAKEGKAENGKAVEPEALIKIEGLEYKLTKAEREYHVYTQ